MDSRRGFVPEDVKEFNRESQVLLRSAQQDLLYLIEKGYPIKSASTFVGNHYLLSERQRLAIVRASGGESVLRSREGKKLSADKLGKIVHIDGLNVIITLEVALSKGTLIKCMDQTIRDLAGLRGTYRLIEQTDSAILMIGEQLTSLKVEEAVFYLDAPVSNTGWLKQKLLDLLKDYPFRTTVELVNNADVILENLENVITSDAIILNKCRSWFNLTSQILDYGLLTMDYIDLSDPYSDVSNQI